MDFLRGTVQVLFREVGKVNTKVPKEQRDVWMVNEKEDEEKGDVGVKV